MNCLVFLRKKNLWSPFLFSKRSQKKSKKRGSGLGPTIPRGSATHASTLNGGLTLLKSQFQKLFHKVISQFFIYPKLVCESFDDNFAKMQHPKITWPYCRPVVPGGAGGAMAPPDFGRSVNPI